MKQDFRIQESLIGVGTTHNKRVFLSRQARVRVILQLSFAALVRPRDVINITLYRNPNPCSRGERFWSRKEVSIVGYKSEPQSTNWNYINTALQSKFVFLVFVEYDVLRAWDCFVNSSFILSYYINFLTIFKYDKSYDVKLVGEEEIRAPLRQNRVLRYILCNYVCMRTCIFKLKIQGSLFLWEIVDPWPVIVAYKLVAQQSI